MKKLGILGGMGPESTLLYYKEIATKFKEKDKENNFPELTIEAVNMYEMLRYCRAGQYDLLAEYLLKGIRNLEGAGVEFIVIASNTPHIVFEALEKEAKVPLLSILEPTYRQIEKKGLKKVAWLGIDVTMEQPYFRKLFIENGIDVVVPNKEERIFIDRIIADELEFGIVKDKTKNEVTNIIERLISEEGIEGIILGCTELPLMYSEKELSIPAFDTVKYHIDGIVEYMFKK